MAEEDYPGGGGGFIDTGSTVVASKLAGQLGTDTADLARNRYDMRRLSVIQNKDIRFLLYAKIKSRKSQVWRTLYNEYLNLKVSVDGRGRRDIIRMEAVSRGGAASVESEIRDPGWIGRNITDRNFRERQLREAAI